MSDIPRARRIIEDIVVNYQKHLGPSIANRLRHALSLMHRVPSTRRAPAKKQKIDNAKRLRVKALLRTTDLSQHEIANRTGLRNAGRVSNIAHGQR